MHNPSLLLIRLGTNDTGAAHTFDKNVRNIVAHAVDQGVPPVPGTRADRIKGPDNINNNTICQIAADYHVPLWDSDLVAQTLPGRGLAGDGIHLTTYYAHDYTSPVALTCGHSVHNLTALMVLDDIRQVVLETSEL